ncbi:MAG TPA: TPM domain-containing protein, partial [Chryseolinea sp.]|nr:TPM domain-containing protein [Chryseolinea sp.]
MKVSNLRAAKFMLQGTTGFLRFACCLAILVTLSVASLAQKPIPELWGLRVHDDAKVLSQQTADLLENRLRAFEDSTSNQISILIVKSLDGESVEEYSLRVAEKWKLGREAKDNGALLLISVDDHKMRIEVGYGLEGVLTDALCSRIIRNEIAPHFRKDDYDGGVTAGIDAIVKGIGGEYTAEDTDEDALADLSWKEKLFIGAFVFGILGIFTFVGLIAPGCGGWFLYAFLVPFYAIFPTILLGVTGGLTLLGVYMV